MVSGDHSILVTHYPVANSSLYKSKANPKGWIFDCVRQVIDALRPLAVVQGHIHDLFGFKKKFEGIQYLFPGPKGIIIDVNVAVPSCEISV